MKQLGYVLHLFDFLSIKNVLVDCLMFSLCFEIQMDMSCLLLYFVILFDAVACMVCFPAVSLFGLMYIAWFSDPIQVTEEERESKCW